MWERNIERKRALKVSPKNINYTPWTSFCLLRFLILRLLLLTRLACLFALQRGRVSPPIEPTRPIQPSVFSCPSSDGTKLMISVLIYSLNYIDALFHAKIITRILSTNYYQCHCSNHLVGIPSVPLGGKVVGPRQTLQVVGQLYRFAICKHKSRGSQRWL